MPYAVAQGTVEVPYIFVQTVIYSLITYFTINLQPDAGELATDPHASSPCREFWLII